MSEARQGAGIGDVEAFLREAVGLLEVDLTEQRRAGGGRPRILPSLCLWAGMLVCVVQGMSSQTALWRLLSTQGVWGSPRFALSDQAIYKRLECAGSGALQRLFAIVSQLLRVRLAPYMQAKLAAFATEVVALDESTLEKLSRTLPSLRTLPKGDPGLLGGKIAGLFDIRRQQWWRIVYRTEVRQDEKVAAREMVSGLPTGTLLLADLGYFGFAWFDDLTTMGHFWLSRLREKTSYIVIHAYYQQGTTFDGIIWLGKYRADKAAHAVRLVQFSAKGVCYQYITNVLDPDKLSLYDMAYLYHRRWDLELALKMLKRELNLHLLWSSKPAVIELQLWAALIVAQVVHGLQVEIAARAGVDIFDVSIALLVEYFPRLAKDGIDPVAFFVEYGKQARLIRPSQRTKIEVPLIPPTERVPLPPALVLFREPRYAHRNC
jgi:hypothetical protein